MKKMTINNYFCLLEDGIKYDEHKKEIEDYLELVKKNEDELGNPKTEFYCNGALPSIQEVSIPDEVYDNLKVKSQKIAVFEGEENLKMFGSYKSYKDKYEEELSKTYKLIDLLSEYVAKNNSDNENIKYLINTLIN